MTLTEYSIIIRARERFPEKYKDLKPIEILNWIEFEIRSWQVRY